MLETTFNIVDEWSLKACGSVLQFGLWVMLRENGNHEGEREREGRFKKKKQKLQIINREWLNKLSQVG